MLFEQVFAEFLFVQLLAFSVNNPRPSDDALVTVPVGERDRQLDLLPSHYCYLCWYNSWWTIVLDLE